MNRKLGATLARLVKLGLAATLGPAVAAAVGLALGLGCSKPMCGNGVIEGDEQCDDGNLADTDGCDRFCRAHAIPKTELEVAWTINGKTGVPGFGGDSCTDVGANAVELHLEGPETRSETLECPANVTYRFTHIVAGDFTVRGRLVNRDQDGAVTPLTEEASIQLSVPQNVLTTTQIDFPIASFLDQERKGTLRFNTTFGGKRCAEASPAPSKVLLTLRRDGTVVTATTGDGVPVDGSQAGACNDKLRSVADLAWGAYELMVAGADDTLQTNYCGRQPIFVGAGIINPTFDLDVPAASVCPD